MVVCSSVLAMARPVEWVQHVTVISNMSFNTIFNRHATRFRQNNSLLLQTRIDQAS